MIIDHIGIVVKNIAKGIDHWKDVFGYSQKKPELLLIPGKR